MIASRSTSESWRGQHSQICTHELLTLVSKLAAKRYSNAHLINWCDRSLERITHYGDIIPYAQTNPLCSKWFERIVDKPKLYYMLCICGLWAALFIRVWSHYGYVGVHVHECHHKRQEMRSHSTCSRMATAIETMCSLLMLESSYVGTRRRQVFQEL